MRFFRLDVPLAGFRPYDAREYQQTYELPPPSTVFGCLLSVLGVEANDASPFFGTRLALGGRTGERSTILRKMRRDPKAAGGKAEPQFRPEYQELLTDCELYVGLEIGAAERDLGEMLESALRDPTTVARHGVVSLGESAFMVDVIARVAASPTDITVLRPSERGDLTLTTWVDFADRSRTRSALFALCVDRLAATDAVHVGPSTVAP